jgi:pimeloyl-ACP methyl ester carboxylesterase
MVGVAWGNGTNGTVEDYAAVIRYWNDLGISVAAATTGQAESGQDIVLAGETLRLLGCRRIVACGHSQGAAGALNAAHDRPDLFSAVCALMPGREADVGWLPCFVVTAEYDSKKISADAVEKRLVKWYPGPILHATKLGIGHFGGENPELMLRVTLFLFGDDRWLDLRTHPGWLVITDRW